MKKRLVWVLAALVLLLVEAGGAAGIVFFYDDPNTKAPVDYIEFFDLQGHLLLISWIDSAGLCQAAMDRGLLDERNPRVERTTLSTFDRRSLSQGVIRMGGATKGLAWHSRNQRRKEN